MKAKKKSREYFRNNPEERKKNDARFWKSWGIMMFFFVLCPFLGLGVGSCNNTKKEQKMQQQLQQSEAQILQSIKEEDYDAALFYANQLHMSIGSESDREIWDEKREEYIKMIEDKKKNTK